MKAIFLILFCAAVVCGQEAAKQPTYLTADINLATTHHLGYQGFQGGVGASGGFNLSRVAVLSSFGIEKATKIDAGNGVKVSGLALLRYPLASRFFVEGGGEIGQLSTSAYSKVFKRPIIGGGFNWQNRAILFADTLLDDNTENHVKGARVGVEVYQRLTTRLGLRIAGECRFYAFGSPFAAPEFRLNQRGQVCQIKVGGGVVK